ncbi:MULTISPECIES: sugar-binding protein [unclassified Micromonospora]|uniref:sugar-binding protein n=1 Tax=unclassified Micromonospora TaxID=2617518 RepID=UPI00188E5813|nr:MULTISPECIES: sugar-binding protein [unclassified Micromonospora]MBF5028757.1 PIG-L family deacetylase [Micromonospora sp. ANENR4]WBC00976.1 PIG-L family deacetylase [Micromonospora sp. WMMA1976]
MRWRTSAAIAMCGLLSLGLATPAQANPQQAAPKPQAKKSDKPVDLDIMFIGAHPDDEAGQLGMLGYWNEYHGMKAGVITTTRGEGGGNATGLEEGPELGILREAEERKAVGWAGVEHIYNLDALDFWYTASAPLTEEVWGHQETLSRIVRVLRTTKPEVILTMNPSATQGNHGNHQKAAMLAVEAFYAAADPKAFPEQIKKEGLKPWRVSRIFQTGGSGTTGTNGPACETTFTPAEASNVIFGTWQGYESARHDGNRWNTVQTWARREYVSQGWGNSSFPSTDPNAIGCNRLTLIDTRTPYPDPNVGAGTGALQGATLRAPGGLPLGTEVHVRPRTWEAVGGQPIKVDTVLYAEKAVPGAKVTLSVPAGWTVSGNGNVGTLTPGKEVVKTFTVTPPAQVEVGTRFKLDATLTSKKDGSGTSSARVQGTAPVRGTLEPLEEIADFRAWTVRNKTQQLDALIESLLNIPSGGTRSVKVNLTNHGTRVESGAVKLNVPAGFSVAEQQVPYSGLQPGASTSVTFTVSNTDTSLPTANRAPDNGAYRVQIETSYTGGSASEPGAFNLVPVTTIPKAATAPTVDGHGHDHEYTGEVIDISTRWEGTAAPASDISGTAQLTHTDDALYAIFNITDDVLGTVLPPEDCKRPRRNDNIEFGIDPRGNSANTSTVFNMALFPATNDPANGNPPCFARERDNHQGGPETAPGVEIASVVTSPYTGYRIEVKIPFSVLPDTIDPNRMGLNILVNDSDTQDLSSQTRVGWSTWSGVRADPWRWGNATLPDLAAKPSAPKAPIMPDTAALSVDSPQTLLQSVSDGVAPGGYAKLADNTVKIKKVTRTASKVSVQLQVKKAGTARAFLWDGTRVVAEAKAELRKDGTLVLPLSGSLPAGTSLLVSYEHGGATTAAAKKIC